MAFGVEQMLGSIMRTVSNTSDKGHLQGIKDVLSDFLETPGFLNDEDKPKVNELIDEIERKLD
ncbi:hypothetical protein MNBD_GAMMA12-355 [hydrothermal vent metagenome]|uniref:Uncharacterized protein n=1 Tax=hydrothermal vent metagenome TaxID=652676 RepID=A0A3B0YXW5_9ZZZZ